jgi:hypothetical protein
LLVISIAYFLTLLRVEAMDGANLEEAPALVDACGFSFERAAALDACFL